jgi:hypothetical protein
MRSRLLLLALATTLAPQGLAAQACFGGTCRTASLVTVTVGTMLRLSLDRTPVVMAAPTSQDIKAGYQKVAGPSARVGANAPWRLEVSAASETWSTDNSARTGKPATDLEWASTTGGAFVPLSTAPEVAALGSPTSGTDVPLAYRTRYESAQDTPGTYSLAVRYTLTSR